MNAKLTKLVQSQRLAQQHHKQEEQIRTGWSAFSALAKNSKQLDPATLLAQLSTVDAAFRRFDKDKADLEVLAEFSHLLDTLLAQNGYNKASYSIRQLTKHKH